MKTLNLGIVAHADEAAVKAKEAGLLSGRLIARSPEPLAADAMTIQDARTYLYGVTGSFFDVHGSCCRQECLSTDSRS